MTSLPAHRSFVRTFGVSLALVPAAWALVALASCGRVDTPAGSGVGTGGDGGSDATGSTPPVDAAGWTEPPWDALAVDVQEPIPPDSGPPPTVACTSASDGGVPCPLPPSRCVDDHWLLFYSSGDCGDAGVCVYQTYEYQCPPSPIAPDCADGGCKITPVLR